MARKSLRLGHFLLLVSLLVGLLAGRLAWLQLARQDELAARATSGQQDLWPATELTRGDIVDRYGQSLTGAGLYPGLVILPEERPDPRELAALADILGVDGRQMAARIGRESGPSVLVSLLAPAQVQALQTLPDPHWHIAPVFSYYGPWPLAVHLVGHLGPRPAAAGGPEEGMAGVKGLEAIYDVYLQRGQPRYWWPVVRDGRGRLLPGLSFQEVLPDPDPGYYQIVTTIDLQVQAAVEKVMNESVPRGAVVVLDPWSGDVLAMASRPAFDPRQPVPNDVADGRFLNRALEHYYPGSVFKVVLAAAALEDGVLAGEAEFYCSGRYLLPDGPEYSCWKADGHGRLTLDQALAQSCNPAFIQVGLQLGRENIIKYARGFGLDQDVLIGYPLPSFDELSLDYGPAAVANASLGQEGVRVSPLQVAGMLAAVAGDGIYHVPRVVQEIKEAGGEVVESFVPPPGRRVVSPATSARLQAMLELVTREGTGQQAWVSGRGSAGKTGTATSGTRDSAGRPVTNSWFAGWYPLEDPDYVIVVFKENVEVDAAPAAVVFREIVRTLPGR